MNPGWTESGIDFVAALFNSFPGCLAVSKFSPLQHNTTFGHTASSFCAQWISQPVTSLDDSSSLFYQLFRLIVETKDKLILQQPENSKRLPSPGK
jgi:hypothetical protein